MKATNFIATLFIMTCFSSCISNSNEDVVKSFETLLNNHFDSYKKNPREGLTMLGGGWVKKKYELSGAYKYDIQTTNSLITPYTAYCEFTLKGLFTDFHEIMEAAINDTLFVKSDLKVHKHYYSYQDGKWIVSKRENKGYDRWYDCNEVILRGENEGQANIFGCWENNMQ